MNDPRAAPDRRAVLVGLALFASCLSAHAQDSHYWSNQYGTVSELLGGAVVGSTRDLSATYYNPGALGFVDHSGAMLTSDVFQFTNTTLEDGAGAGVDLDSDRVSRSPTFAAGMVRFDWLGPYRLAYSSLTRQQFDIRVDERRAFVADVIGDASPDTFVGDLRANVDLKEVWGGLTLARPFGSQASVGVTQYLAYRSHKASLSTLAQAATPGGGAASTFLLNDFRYKNLRLLWKAGVALNRGPWSFGLTATSPSVRISGSGSATDNTSVIGVDLDGDGSEDPVIESDFQENLSSEYRSPVALGAGVAYRRGGTALHLSAEWYGAVEEYEVLDTAPFVGQTSGAILRNVVTHELEDVLNGGLGVEQRLGARWTGYVSLATDFSAKTSSVLGDDISIATWDIYQVSGGLRYETEDTGVILGIAWSFGDTQTEQLVDFTDPGEGDRLVGSLGDATFRYTRIKLLFGVDFSL